MSKLFVLGKPALLILIIALLNQSCGLLGGRGGDNGELVGSAGRDWTGMVIPYGMVPIPAGTFHMGQADEDIAATQINFNKQVTIGAFFMDDSEITNNEYRQFMEGIFQDSLSILGEDFVMNELYPDTTVWVKDFAHHMGDPLLVYYWSHPAFDNFPVVGVDYEAAKYFAQWRSAYLNDFRASITIRNITYICNNWNSSTIISCVLNISNIGGIISIGKNCTRA